MTVPSEHTAIEMAKNLLTSWLGKSPVKFRSPDAKTGADLVAERGSLRIIVEYKGASEASIVGAAISQVKHCVQLHEQDAVPVVVVPYMGETGKGLCRAAGVSWFDLSGNASITAPGLVIFVEGQPNQFPRRGRPSSVFAPRSSRITRRMLIESDRWFRPRELARETELDAGFTSRIMRKLIEDGLITRRDDGAVQVHNFDLLLDSWAEACRFEDHMILRGHVTTRTGEELLAHMGAALKETKIQNAATGLAAAWLLAPFAEFRLVTFFAAERPSDVALRDMGFREEPRGANVWIVVPKDGGVFDGAEERNGISCVHPVQAYVDLRGQPERAKEAAAELRARLLRPRAR